MFCTVLTHQFGISESLCRLYTVQQQKLNSSSCKDLGSVVMLGYVVPSALILQLYLASTSDKGDRGDILVGSPFKVTHARNLRDDVGVTVLPVPKYFCFFPDSTAALVTSSSLKSQQPSQLRPFR